MARITFVSRMTVKAGKEAEFERTDLYEKVFALADRNAGAAVPRALVPSIQLHSIKITRKLTTDWFTRRVHDRYRNCLNTG